MIIYAKVILSKGRIIAAEVAKHSDIMIKDDKNTKCCYMKFQPKVQNVTFFGVPKGYAKPTQHELKVICRNDKVYLNDEHLSNKDYTFFYMTAYAGVRLLN